MLDITCDPRVTPGVNVPDTFVQTVRLTRDREVIGQARWHCAADPAQGIAQLLELTIAPPHRRQEFGRRLMEAVTAQAREFFKSRKSRLRRVWISIEQERQVIGRSFLMQFGFHHVGTVQELLKGEDLLIYMRTFD
jgi:GNAT superfamily N-acetyltransferase